MLPESVMLHIRYRTGAADAIQPRTTAARSAPNPIITGIVAACSAPTIVTRFVSRAVRRYLSPDRPRPRIRRGIADEPTLIIDQ